MGVEPRPYYGRDPQRRLNVTEARELYERANGQCQKCDALLGADWHQAHLTAYAHGGATSLDNMQAWCPTCNLSLGANDVSFGEIKPRQWQEAALPEILLRLYEAGSATLSAGMGSGKTIFSAFVLKSLISAGYIQRVVFVVPNLNLVEQVASDYAKLGVHLDTSPRDGVIELQGTVGCVVTYHSLPTTARAHVTRMQRVPTLVIFDEVHHLADNAAWGAAAKAMVGNPASGEIENVVGVLNMTGTLFRSSGKNRISTVRYEPLEDGKIQAIADHTVPIADLIGIELRGPDVYLYGTEVKLLDLEEGDVIEGAVADLDDRQRRAGIRGAFKNRKWVRGFCEEAIELLRRSLAAIDHREPLKLLYVAHDQQAARIAADVINEVTGRNFARLVISDEPKSLQVLRDAKRERYSCAIVTVAMVTEGFDCPQVAVEAYASNKVADLFVAQAGTRTMRLTPTERADGRYLPATILIPDHPEMRRAFGRLLQLTRHTINEDDDSERAGGGGGAVPLPRYHMLDVGSPELKSTNVLSQEDGVLQADEFSFALDQCREVGIPEIYAPRVGVVARRNRPLLRTSDPVLAASTGRAVTVAEANPREINLALRERVKQVAGWMAKHVAHDKRFENTAEFQWRANEAAGIKAGGRDRASAEELERCRDWMVAQVQEHCRDHEERLPSWADGLEDD